LAEALAVKAEAESKEAVRRAAAIPSMLDGRVVVVMPPSPEARPSAGSHRLGLADLNRAAQERRARQ
jgi:hypothetical protein